MDEQDKEFPAPRITLADIEANIKSEHYINVGDVVLGFVRPAGCGMQPEDLLTICVLVLNNGFTVTGESACASPENFDAEYGQKVARQNAINKIWPLMGYMLKQQLHDAQK